MHDGQPGRVVHHDSYLLPIRGTPNMPKMTEAEFDAAVIRNNLPLDAAKRRELYGAFGKMEAMIERVFTATATSFGEQGMEFEPLLPDDEEPLNGRANALALWCTGFLYGLGTGQISDLEGLNGEVGEIVRDFTEISRATGDEADADEANAARAPVASKNFFISVSLVHSLRSFREQAPIK